jgi:type III restriction enzyme
MEDTNVAHKDRAAKLYCENASLLVGKPWQYLKVRQTEYNQLQPDCLADLVSVAGGESILL